MSDTESSPAAAVHPADKVDEQLAPPAPRPIVAAEVKPAPERGSGQQAKPAPDPLRSIQWLAMLGVAALVLGRFLAPALPGSGVGMASMVRAFEVLGGALTQLFAVGLLVGMSRALIQTASANIPPWLRLLAMATATYAALVVVGGAATSDRGPGSSTLIAGLCAGGFAIVAALASRASRVARIAAFSLALVGAAAVARGIFGLLSLHAAKVMQAATLATIGRITATLSVVLVAGAAALSVVYIGRAARPEVDPGAAERPSLWSPWTLLVLVLAVVCARQAAIGATADAGPASVLLKRAADRFLHQPEPYMRAPIRLFLGFLTPLTAVALLTVRRVRTLSAALCLAIVAADVTDAPLGPLTLVLASLGVLLMARSGHVLWSALIARPPAPPSRVTER